MQRPGKGLDQGESPSYLGALEPQNGSEVRASLDEIYGRYSPLLYRYLSHRVRHPGLSVDDLVQDTFLSVMKGADSYRPERGTLLSWLFTIASNVYKQKIRQQAAAKREAQEISLEDLPVLEWIVADDRADAAASDPLEAMIAEERREALRNALEHLPPQMKRAVVLRVGDDLRYREIAEIMKVSIETVKAHLYQARQVLRTILAQYFDDFEI